MPERILVTGATGFLGSHVVNMLLEEGYNVRATARRAKMSGLLEVYGKFVLEGRMEVFRIMDLANEQFPQIFEGVDALIHIASPQVGREGPECTLRNTVQGTLNVIRQAEKVGVKRIVVTSAAATACNPAGSITDKDWYPASEEFALRDRKPLIVFSTAKTLAEKAIWEFADAHPNVDITTINPPIMYGPLADTHKVPKPDFAALSANVLIYRLLFPLGSYPTTADHADVRDVARAHVQALRSPPSIICGRKRILVGSPHSLDFARIIQHIGEKRPEMEERLTKLIAPKFERDKLPVDFDRIEDVLDMRKAQFKSVEETFLDTVDQLVAMETSWAEGGYTIDNYSL